MEPIIAIVKFRDKFNQLCDFNIPMEAVPLVHTISKEFNQICTTGQGNFTSILSSIIQMIHSMPLPSGELLENLNAMVEIISNMSNLVDCQSKPLLSDIDNEPILQVWAEFKNEETEELRQQLAEHYWHIVQYHSKHIHAKLPPQVDIQDLYQAGYLGLRDAINSYQITWKIKFGAYCVPRVRGAIMDELRHMDWAPRLVRQRASKIDNIRNKFATKHGINPTEDDIASELHIDTDEVRKIIKDGRAVNVISFNRRWGENDCDKKFSKIINIKDERQVDPTAEAQKQDLKEYLTKGMSREERLIVVLYYYEEFTMKKIGEILNLSESRISQMHSSIIARLRNRLAG